MKHHVHFVTGAAGFIGSNLVDRLLALGGRVTGFDNFSTGRREFLEEALKNPAFTLIEGDLLKADQLPEALGEADLVWHLAANADVRFGLEHPRRDLDQNTIATHNLLEAMRRRKARTIVFSSTGSIYGEPLVHPTPEDAPFPVQTSLYGASKAAAEAFIQAYCEGFGFRAYIFRFVSVLGERYTHGHVFDFCRGLLQDPSRLKILGDGRQRKSYLYVQDCLEGMLLALNKARAEINIFNLGVDGYVEVDQSVETIVKDLGAAPRLEHQGGTRGWIGDSPLIWLDTSRIRALGWKPKVSILEGVSLTVKWLLANQWVFEVRN